MEGFLLKKGRGEGGIFGRKNWKKRWFILEGSYVTYYETFSLNKNEPVNKKGTAPVRGCTISLDKDSEKKFGFVMTHETRKPLHMAAETEKMMKLWMKALEKAATGQVGPVTIKFDEFFDALGMEHDASYTHSELNKFYRKAALKNHPDKGGDVEAFKHIQESFEVLKARLEEEEEEKLWTTMDYVASIEKGVDGVGFGMVVVEDSKKSRIIAKRVMDKIILRDIESSSGGAINGGDQIVKIDNDDITTWTLMRVVQRLNEFRAPIGTVVKFTFRRRIRIGSDGNEEEEQPPGGHPAPTPGSDFAEDERIFQEQQARQQREEEETRRRMAASCETDINDIDEDDVDSQFGDDINDIDEGPYGENEQNFNNSGGTVASAGHSYSVADEENQKELQREKDRREEKAKQRMSWEQKDPMDHIACLQAENDEMEKELSDLRRELREVKQECASYKSNYHDMMLDLEDVREEAHMFLEQLEAAELECQGASRREMAAMDVINQLSGTNPGGAPIPAEVSQQVLQRVQEAADMVQKGYDLTGEYGYNLEDSLQLPNDQSVEYAQKNAFSAAMMVDKSGVFSQKYDQDTLAADLLSRLEESLRVLSDQPPSDGGQGWFSDDVLEHYPGRRSFEHHGEEVKEEQKPKKSNHRPPPPPPASRGQQHHDVPQVYDNNSENIYSSSPQYTNVERNDFDQFSDYRQPYQSNNYQQSSYSNSHQNFDNYHNQLPEEYHHQQSYHDQHSYNHHSHIDDMNNSNMSFQSPSSQGYVKNSVPSLSSSFSSSISNTPIKFGPRKKSSKSKKGTKNQGYR